MMFAHLPAGYVVSKLLQKKLNTTNYLGFGILGSIIPDIDMFYFYLIDDRQTNHHDFITHWPLFWGASLVLFLVLIQFLRDKTYWGTAGLFFYINVFTHMLLDSYAGYIKWLMPFSDLKFNLIDVPARFDFWVWNFVLHWSFLAEVGIILAAIWIFFMSKTRVVKT